MDTISRVYAIIRKRKSAERQRNSPREALARESVTNPMPLNGSPKEFGRQDNLPSFRLVKIHRVKGDKYKSNMVMMNRHILTRIAKNLNDKEVLKPIPTWYFTTEKE